MTPNLWGGLGLAAAAVALAWVFRYETIPAHAGQGLPAAYLVNRWTGTTYVMRGSSVHEVEEATPKLVEVDYEPRPLSAAEATAFDRFLNEDLPAKTPGKAPNPFDQFDR